MSFEPRFPLIAPGILALALLAAPAAAQTDSAEEATATTAEEGAATGAEPAAAGEAPAADAAETGAPEETEEAAGPDETELEVTAAKVLASVNGQDITLGEVISLRRDLPEQYQQLPDEILSQGLLDQIIDQTVLEQAARADGFDDRLDVALAIRNQIRAVLAESWLRAEVARRLTDDVLQAAYEERFLAEDGVEEMRASHILVESEELAQELRTKLDEGADFAELAAEHGTDGTATRGGDLGWFAHEDMVPQFADAAFALQPGETAGPVQSPFGWHLIKVAERRERPAPPFEEVRPGLIAELAQEIQGRVIEELRDHAELSVAEPPVAASAIRADVLIEPEPQGSEQ